MNDIREWAERARKMQEAVNELGAGPPASRLADDDQELIAEARRVGYLLRRCSGDVDRLAGALLAELADRLDAAQATEDDPADADAARKARASIKAGEPVIPWEQVKAESGDDDQPR